MEQAKYEIIKRDPNGQRETSEEFPAKRATIIAVSEVGALHSGEGTIDSNPDRTNFTIKPINCTVKEFLLALLKADKNSCFCIYDNMVGELTDIGGFSQGIAEGDILCISNGEIRNENYERQCK